MIPALIIVIEIVKMSYIFNINLNCEIFRLMYLDPNNFILDSQEIPLIAIWVHFNSYFLDD